MHINYSWNFHQNIFTLTIYFIVLNAAIEFVLIYRPHPVYPVDLELCASLYVYAIYSTFSARAFALTTNLTIELSIISCQALVNITVFWKAEFYYWWKWSE